MRTKNIPLLGVVGVALIYLMGGKKADMGAYFE